MKTSDSAIYLFTQNYTQTAIACGENKYVFCQESRPGVLSLSTRGRHLPSSWTQLSSLHTPVHPLIIFPAGPHHLWTI